MSSQEQFDELVARIEHLEAQNYGLKRVGVIALVLLFIVGASVVYQTWAELGAVVTQGVILSDAQGPRYGMTVTPQGSLGVLAYRGGMLPGLAGAPEAIQGMTFYDSQGRARVAIGIGEGDQPRLVVFNENGQRIWQAVDLVAAPPPAPPAASPSPAAPSPSPAGGSASPGPKPQPKPSNK